eukprot:TRINITY_DN13957_c0_g1_i1.p1 TRINITY_DN13957_c0_g1~~TRINITY_DN13957_c0_g1_i1.p1  ORF type:complete len:885 (+),score=385.47 TRINITY_DN13957_c0_g1_i1:44-2656(+)
MGGEEPVKRFLLPTDVIPKHYVLKLELDFDTYTFKGECRIDVDVAKPTTDLVVNAAELKFSNAVIEQNGASETINGEDIELNADDERATCKLKTALQKGAATLTYTYQGTLNDQMRGFYRSKYTKEVDGEKVERYMATTQFEPVDARRALPCWDEPLHKATFDVVLVFPEELTALSNMQEVSESTENGLRTVTYATTPKMSTYLLAFAVGEFEYIETTIKTVHGGNDNRIRVYATQGQQEKGRLALDVAAKCLPLYEKFFGVDYPLPKCDLIAVPDFASGAMENWGLITYRESCLLADETSSIRARVFVSLVVCHELAHQWFGNLVTMEWWKELWLNESFATFMEFDSVDQLFPHWQVWTQFVAEDFQSALTLDALLTSHPVEVDVSQAQEIDEIFDDISYAKGCSLMRMAVTWIGMENFQKAMMKYMTKHAYGNATTIDLWNALEEESKMPVSDVMANWTKEQGYPVLTAELLDNGDIQVSQNRFLSARLPNDEESKQMWKIPIVMGTDKGESVHLLKEKVEVIKPPAGCAWVKLNFGQTSLCRVLYKGKLLDDLAQACKSAAISNVDRTGVVNDMTALTTAGLVSAVDLLKFVSNLEDEKDVAAWSAIEGGVAEVAHMLRDSEEACGLMDAFKRKLFKKIAEELGWDTKEGDDDRTKQLRGSVQGVLARSGDEAALKEAKERFEKYRKGDEGCLTADLRLGVFKAVVKFGGDEEWDILKEMHENAVEPVEKVRCLRSLGASKNEATMKKCLEYAMSDKTRPQDASALLATVSGDCPQGTEIFRDYMMANFESILTRLGNVTTQRLCPSLGDSTNIDDIAAIKSWWATVDEIKRKVADRTVLQAIENIEVYHKFKSRDFDQVVAFLKQN